MSRELASPADGVDAFLARLTIETPSPTIVTEAETGTVVAVNRAATELFGRDRSSLVGMHRTELHPPGATPRCRDGRAEQRDRAETGREPLSILRSDGSTTPVDAQSTTLVHNDTEYVLLVFRDASERVARRNRLERQATAMDLTTSGIALLNDAGEYTYLNGAHVSMFGYDDAADLVGGTWRQLYDDDAIERIEAEVLPVVAETGSWDGELVGVKRDGTPITQRVSLARLPDGGITCVNLDLSDRERRLRQLEQTRSFATALMTADGYEAVVDTAVEAVTTVTDHPFSGYWTHETVAGDPTDSDDPETDALVPVSVSEAGASLVGTAPRFRPNESLAWDAFDAGAPAYHPDVAAERNVYNPDTPIGAEFIVPVGDDGVFIVAAPARDGLDEGERELVLIITEYLRTAIRLVAQRRQLRAARDRIEAERNQLERVIDTVPQLVFAKNTDGEFLLANEAVADAYGTTTAELIGSTDADYAADSEEVDAFTDDDRRVIETGEPLYRTAETLTDAAGAERVLETWKIPFTPAGSDEDAVLGVANDITDLTDARDELDRQRRLTNLYSVSNRVLQATDPADAFDACVEAIADVVAAAEISIHDRDSADGALARRATAGPESESRVHRRIQPGETELWRAFGEPGACWLPATAVVDAEAAADRRALVTRLGETSLLAVVVDDRDETLESFIRAVSQQVSAALTRIRQEASIVGLSDDVASARQRADRYRDLGEAVVDAVDAVSTAETRAAVHEAVVGFGDRVAAYAFVGAYDPVAARVDPVAVSEPGGPAKLYDAGDEAFPAVAAASRDEPRRVGDGRAAADGHGEWRDRLLQFGYRESLAVPVSHRGTVHAVAEFASTSAGRFDGPERRAIEAVTTAAGTRLSTLDAAAGADAPVTFDIECRDPAPLFPDLPDRGTVVVDRVAVTGPERFRLTGRVEGCSAAAFRECAAATPGVEIDAVDPVDADVHEIAVRMTATPGRSLAPVRDTLGRTDTRLVGARSRPDAEVLSFRTTDPTAVGRVREELSAVSGSCRLVAKRHRTEAAGGLDTAGGDRDLTTRQREVIETALREGYYDDPRGISGADLADRFDLSSSTLHQHLRAAESKVIRGFFD